MFPTSTFGALAGALLMAATAARPVAADWTGPYIGTHIGGHFADAEVTGEFDNPDVTTIGLEPETFVAGGQVGYNYQMGGIVAGIEGAVSLGDGADSLGVRTPGSGDAGDDFASVVYGHTVSLVGRLGLPLAGGLMPFVKAGVAWADVDVVAGDTDGVPPVLDATDLTAASGWESGYVIGAGLELPILANWTLRAEYEFMDFGSFSVANGDGDAHRYDIENHAIKVGVNLHF